jgi:hypothetical protein
MNRTLLICVLVLATISGLAAFSKCPGEPLNSSMPGHTGDSLKYKQLLYNGILWKNKYHRIDGDQFLFSNIFLPGSVTINGHTFNNLRIKYDIFSDEIITPLNLDEIVQLNKELVDSFSLNVEDVVYRFVKVPDDTLKILNGYVNVIYKGASSVYVKYIKLIRPIVTDVSDGEFYQVHRLYIENEDNIYPVSREKDMLEMMGKDKIPVKNYITKNKIRISKKNPESFVPAVRYYDTLNQQEKSK